jgi:hypothetical protein
MLSGLKARPIVRRAGLPSKVVSNDTKCDASTALPNARRCANTGDDAPGPADRGLTCAQRKASKSRSRSTHRQNLQALGLKYGGLGRVPPAQWAAYDEAMVDWEVRRKARYLTA